MPDMSCNSNWIISKINMISDPKCKNCKRLTVEYTVKDKFDNVNKVVIEGIPLRFGNKPIISKDYSYLRGEGHIIVDFGFGEIQLDEKSKIIEERIETATKKMTVEEIEKALGYNVEIVSEKKQTGECTTCKHKACIANDEPCLGCRNWNNWEKGGK